MKRIRSEEHISTEAAHSQRFRLGSLEAWRAAFLMSLGQGVAGCGGDVTASLPTHLRCESERPLQGSTGLWQCDNGVVHRRPRNDGAPCVGCVSPPLATARDECQSDADCPDGVPCALTRDLLDTRVVCGNPIADVSAPYFACLTSADACGGDTQCLSGVCALDDGARECVAASTEACGVPGRPFLVGAEVRRAPLRAGEGWSDSSAHGVVGLSASQRARLSAHYEQAALLEHASIAAFARFTLQLLELGAPADLCSAAQDAMRDETLHARLCFTLASRYAGQPLAPGPLSMTGVLATGTLLDAARLCLLEGCVGETLAALDAAEALASATDPEVRAALARIADDERRHAELAYRFMAWALEQNPTPGSRRALAAVLDATVTASRSARGTQPDDVSDGEAVASNHDSRARADDDPGLEAHGVLSERRRSQLRRAALEEVVVPCVRRLLAEADTGRSEPALALTA